MDGDQGVAAQRQSVQLFGWMPKITHKRPRRMTAAISLRNVHRHVADFPFHPSCPHSPVGRGAVRWARFMAGPYPNRPARGV